MPEIEYTSLSVQDRLLIAKDQLRAKETDHFRLTLEDEAGTADTPAGTDQNAERRARLAEAIEALKGTVAALEAEAEAVADEPA